MSLEHPTDRVAVIATLPNPLTIDDVSGYADHVVLCSFSEPLIARWWNAGLDYIRERATSEHEVLAISSDYVGASYSVAMLGVFLRQHNLTMAGPNPWSNHQQFFDISTPRHSQGRVPGGCWMLAGESGLRVDEDFRWWYSDDDFDMQARQRSRSGIIPDTRLVAEADTPLSEEKQRWAVEDRAKFIVKWGQEPW